MRYVWEYCTFGRSLHGNMICTACKKPIQEGRYRVRQANDGAGDWGYAPQHELCSQSDPNWAAMDRRYADAAERHSAFIADCKAFRNKWGIGALDDYIGKD